jgi:hypothetical protein
MNRIGISLTSAFAGAFAACLLFPSGLLAIKSVQIAVAVFVLVAYCVVIFVFVDEKKRELPLKWQTALGVVVALTVAAAFHASSAGYALALLLGVALGASAHKWVWHVQMP